VNRVLNYDERLALACGVAKAIPMAPHRVLSSDMVPCMPPPANRRRILASRLLQNTTTTGNVYNVYVQPDYSATSDDTLSLVAAA